MIWPFNKLFKCKHKFNYAMDMTPRNARGSMACPCMVCGHVFMAKCGLDLPGELVQAGRALADKPAE